MPNILKYNKIIVENDMLLSPQNKVSDFGSRNSLDSISILDENPVYKPASQLAKKLKSRQLTS